MTEQPEWKHPEDTTAYRRIRDRWVGLMPLIGGRARIVDHCDWAGYGEAFW